MTALGLVISLCVAAPEVAVEAGPAYGLGLRPGLGALTAVTLSWDWAELGVLGGYQAEPYQFFESYLQGAHVTGATHRVQVLASAGVKWKPWRLELGAQLIAGYSHVLLHGTFENTKWGVSGALDESVGAFTLGAGLCVALRVTDHFQVKVRGVAPLPFASGVTGYATIGLVVAFGF